MRPHGLGPGVDFTTRRTGGSVNVVFSLEVSVESLHEGSPHVTDVTTPGLVVLVVSVHVVHQASEAATLLAEDLCLKISGCSCMSG